MKVLKPIIREYRPGRFREIHVLVEVDEHPAAMREQIEEQLRRRLRDEVSVEQLIAALYRYASALERAAKLQLSDEDAKEVEQVHELFARLTKLQAKAEALQQAAATMKAEELQKLDIRTDDEWFDRKPPKGGGGKEDAKPEQPVKP